MFPIGLLNLVNGFSNFPVIYVINSCLQKNDKITACISLFVGLASFLSHLAENHKHNLPGVLGLNPRQSYLLNRIDVLGALLTSMRAMVIYHNRYGFSLNYFYMNIKFTYLLLPAIILNILSERLPIIANNPILFTLTHSTWHITIFSLFNYFINDY